MKKIICTVLSLLMLVSFAACNTTETPTDSDETTLTETESVATTESETIQTTESEKETVTETETQTEVETEPPVEAALPEGEPDLTFTCADGMVQSQYNEMTATDFRAAAKYYAEAGYILHSSNRVGETRSATYLSAKDDSYYTLLYNGGKGELTIGYKETGKAALAEGLSLAEASASEFSGEMTTTVTQLDTSKLNGMSYIVKLSDGSFLVIDGGYEESLDNFYATLCKLNGGEEDIHIRGWFLSHSHGDHFYMFRKFADTMANKVKLDTVFYAPAGNVKGADPYFVSQLPNQIKKFTGAVLCQVHTGMVLEFVEVKVEVLFSYEQTYKTLDPDNFNETSTAIRLSNGEGSMIFLGDLGINGCNWMIDAYGEALKSDMVQVAHHGVENSPMAVYDLIKPTSVFWPCDEGLMGNTRGEVRQPLIIAEYAKEHLVHGYGNITRLLSHKAEASELLDVMPKRAGEFKNSAHASGVTRKNGVMCYTVLQDKGDPYVAFDIDPVSTEKYNAVKLVVSADACEGSSAIFFSTSENKGFAAERSKGIGQQGISVDGETMTVLVYLGNLEGFTGDLTSLRIDLGSKAGQTIELHSIELYWVDVD